MYRRGSEETQAESEVGGRWVVMVCGLENGRKRTDKKVNGGSVLCRRSEATMVGTAYCWEGTSGARVSGEVRPGNRAFLDEADMRL